MPAPHPRRRALLAGLRAVPWASFRHAYGDARDTPRALAAVLSTDADTRRAAIRYLHHSLVHQGLDRGPATLHAADFVLRMLAEPTVRDRDRLVDLLAYFAVGEPANLHYFFNGYDLDANFGPGGSVEYGWLRIDEANPGSERDLAYGAVMRGLFARVVAATPLLLSLLAARSVRLRRSVPALLGWLAPRAAEIVPALLLRLHRERDAAARCNVAVALSLVTQFDRRLTGTAAQALAAQRARSDEEALWLAVARLRQPFAVDRAVLRRVLRLGATAGGGTAWSAVSGDESLLALALHRCPEARADIYRAGLRALRTSASGYGLSEWLGWHAATHAELDALQQVLRRCRASRALAVYGNLAQAIEHTRAALDDALRESVHVRDHRPR